MDNDRRNCTRNPPQVDTDGDTVFPVVAPDWWCGEFAPAEKLAILPDETDEEELP